MAVMLINHSIILGTGMKGIRNVRTKEMKSSGMLRIYVKKRISKNMRTVWMGRSERKENVLGKEFYGWRKLY